MSAIRHLREQPFVAATAVAALAHSTWALGTMFSGTQPMPPIIGDPLQAWFEFVIKTAAWHLPAFAIAFAFDVGQVVTAHEIRTAHAAGRKPWRKYAAFIVFALATYYLQMVYCAHHLPAITLGAGVSDAHAAMVQMFIDAGVWVIPAFLPLSTLLYTFAADSHPAAPHASTAPAPTSVVTVTPVPAPVALPTVAQSALPEGDATTAAPKPRKPRKTTVSLDARPTDLFGDLT